VLPETRYHVRREASTRPEAMRPRPVPRAFRGRGARCFLTAWPESTMGTRLYAEPAKGMPALASFNGRLEEVLECAQPVDESGSSLSKCTRKSDARGTRRSLSFKFTASLRFTCT
jgi:hypothetical protein